MRLWVLSLFVAFWAACAQAALPVERVVSPGGIEAWLIRDSANPVISLNLIFRGGSALDPAGKDGLARMVAGLLDEGAGELDSQGFQGRLDDLAISLHFDAGRDTFSGQVKTLSENREEAFRLLRLALTAPRFDAEPVERIRGQLAAMLKQESTSPGALADNRLQAALFPGHPYGRPAKGTLAGLGAVRTEDLRTFVARRLARDNLFVGVAGDIAPADLGRLLDETFGGLPAKAASWALPDIEPAKGRVEVVDLAVPQSTIAFAQAGLKRKDPNFYAAFVLNHILGGGTFSSRLFEEVREKRGLAYSVSSHLEPRDASALLAGSAGTANARAAETVAVVREEWRRLAVRGVGAPELQDAKTYLTGSFPLRFSSSDRIAATLASIQVDGLGIDYLERRNAYIEAVTLEQVNGLAGRLLDPDGLAFVVVGRPEGLAAGASHGR
ncbi:MAG: insulinase family protein [Magnetospirillum sp. WYHS-4]